MTDQLELDLNDLEKQMCPRRTGHVIEESIPYDVWRPGAARWGTHPSDKFPEGFEKPRTCSFCGGVHPEDAIALLKLGWELDSTGKWYKAYMEPPGTMLQRNRIIKAIGNQEKEKEAFRVPHVHPSPPVKLYTMHFSETQIREVNDYLKAQIEKRTC